jgi:4-aminobutyrate aminotransferase
VKGTTRTERTSTAPRSQRDYPRIEVEPPGPRAREVMEADHAVTSSCYIKVYPLAVARGRGAMIEDVDGNRFLDFMAGIGVASTGHSHPSVVEAIKEAADQFLHVCGTDFYYESLAELCRRLGRLAPGDSPKRVFLTNSGAEAVDGAIKLARHATGRTAIIAFDGAFHGRTYGAMSLTSSKAKQRGSFGPFLPDIHHVPYAYCYRCVYGQTYPECGLYCVSAIENHLFARRVRPDDVAAVVVEPVQGEGGYIVPPPDYLRALRDLCDRHGILLVVDEVQTGIGRTGRMFACDHAGVEPDILLTAKGLGSGMPIGAIVARESVDSWGSGAHGSTFGGNPVCCAAALATLDLVEEELVENACRMGEILLDGARDLAERHPVIGDVRGMGLLVGLEFLPEDGDRSTAGRFVEEVVQRAFRKGLLLLSAGEGALRLLPPLMVDEYDVHTALRILDEAVGEVA